MAGWQLNSGGGIVRDPALTRDYGMTLSGVLPGVNAASKAPEYDLRPEAGGLNNPMLQATLRSAGAGGMRQGLSAFTTDDYQSDTQDSEGNWSYNADPLLSIAKGVGFDTSKYNLDPTKQGARQVGNGANLEGTYEQGGILSLKHDLNEHLRDYAGISGLSAGWNPTGDARGRDTTLYRNVDGVLKPVSDSAHDSAPKTGGWIRQNPLAFQSLLGAAGILTGGLAYGAAAGAGAGAAEAGATTAAGAGTAGGSSGGMLSGLSSWYQGLSPMAQAAIKGAATNGVMSGAQGGGIKDIGKAMLMGGVTGGLGSYVGGMMPQGWSPAVRGALGGAITNSVGAGLAGSNPWMGALSGGIAGGLGGMGMNSQLAGLAGKFGAGMLGGGGGAAPSGGGGAAPSGGGGGMSGSMSAGSGAGGLIPNTTAAAEAIERERRSRDSGYAAYGTPSAPNAPGTEAANARQNMSSQLVQALRGAATPKFYT